MCNARIVFSNCKRWTLWTYELMPKASRDVENGEGETPSLFPQIHPVNSSVMGGGRTAPGDTIQGVTPKWNYIFAAKFTESTEPSTLAGGEGLGVATAEKRSSLLRGRWLKKVVSFFERKYRVTPSVAAPSDTIP